MAMAHEPAYQYGDLARDSVARSIGNLLDHLQYSFPPIGLEIRIVGDLEDISFGLDTAVSLGFIVTERISNWFKHAFAGRGTKAGSG